VNVAVSCTEGVPLIAPVDELSVNPVGNDPALTLHVLVPAPPPWLQTKDCM